MKLELKHIIHYLPFGLRGNVSDHECNEHWENEEITSFSIEENILSFRDAIDVYFDLPEETEFKPILRPLSDLTEDKFSSELYDLTEWHPEYIVDLSKFDAENFRISYFSWDFYEWLFQNHFDIFGLIKARIAIDINQTELNKPLNK